MNHKEPLEVATQIQKKIGNRIIICLLIFVLAVFGITAFDILKNFDEIGKVIDLKCKSLADFTVSQLLVDNKIAVNLKIEDSNRNNPYSIFWMQHGKTSNNGILNRKPWLSWEYNCAIESTTEENLGYFHITGSLLQDNALLPEFLARILLVILFTITVFSLLYPLTKKIPKQLFIEPITNLLGLLKTGASQQSAHVLPRELIEIEAKIKQLIDDAYNKSKMLAFAEFSAQVAHDIRSPLTALDLVIKDISNIPEEQRILIRNSANRIYDIANNLLVQYKNKNIDSSDTSLKSMPELIADLILNVVSEKRVQYKNTQIDFVTKIDELSYSGFINVSPSAFKRVMSNLLNNSVEALECKTKEIINISLSTQDNFITVTIKDRGCGIPSDLLKKIVSGEMTTRKKHGNGLGLPYAIRMVEEVWDGQFCIQSHVDEGTTIDIILKRVQAPDWFVSELFILPQTKIVILDDDESIHQVWHKRFEAIKSEIEFADFYNSYDLIEKYKPQLLQPVLFLVDFELIGCESTGLDVIAQLNIAKNAYLVTSRFEDPTIRKQCNKLGVRLIPKNFASHIPIKMREYKCCDAILIDDDSMVHMIWNLAASRAGKKLNVYTTADEFMQDIHNLNVSTPLYIDVNLKDGVRGDIISKNISTQGFKEIYLATGYEKSKFVNMPWIKDIVGKDPPWNI